MSRTPRSRWRRHLAVAATALLASMSVPAPGSAAPGAGTSPSRVHVVDDPRGDARGDRGATPALRRLADLTRVRYTTPFRVGGDLRVTTWWAELRDGTPRRAVSQELVVSVGDARTGASGNWQVYVGNSPERVRVEDFSSDEGSRLLRPRRVTVDRTLGRNGRIDVVLSTEWLRGARRVELRTYSEAWAWGGGEARDRSRLSRPLPVGQGR